MQTIERKQPTQQEPLDKRVLKARSAKKTVFQKLLRSTGIFISVFIMFVVVVAFTTDLKFSSLADWTALGLTFFVLLFCSYSMYLNCSDSGTKAGKDTETFLNTQDDYDGVKNKIAVNKMQGRLPEFCQHYVEEELELTRATILADVGIDYVEYKEKYLGKDKEILDKLVAENKLSKMQADTIINANKVKPITLTPDMIFKRGRGNNKRSPLGMNPQTKKKWNFGIKFVTTLITSVLMPVIACEVIITPNWATFAACLLKLFAVSMQGVFGYKMGFENIVVDTVEYMRDQIDLMQHFLEYVKLTPIDFKNDTAENDGQPEPENGEEIPPNELPEIAKFM